MYFETTYQVADMEVTAAEDHIMLTFFPAMILPTGHVMPTGKIHIAISKEGALTKGQEMIDAGTEVEPPKPKSDIIIANNMAGVEQAAKQVEKLTKAAKGKK